MEFEHSRFVADKNQGLLRIDLFLRDRIEGISRTRIQLAADANYIRVNNVVVKSNYRVKGGDVVTLMLPFEKRELKIIPQKIPLDIVYEDDDLIIVNKSSGMVVHPGCGNYSETLVNALAYHLKESELFKNEFSDIRLGLVHRIDKNTTGLLVVAKTEKAKVHLSNQFFHHTIERCYNALVWGDMEDDYGSIIGNVGRSVSDRQKFTVYPDGDHGKTAVTHYKVLERFGYVTLVECKLETGRTHQIRVHFQYIKHPLFNDDTYGGNQILKGTRFANYSQFVENCFNILPRQALHAKTLGFIHPSTWEFMKFNSELADDMKEIIEKWRNYSVHLNQTSL